MVVAVCTNKDNIAKINKIDSKYNKLIYIYIQTLLKKQLKHLSIIELIKKSHFDVSRYGFTSTCILIGINGSYTDLWFLSQNKIIFTSPLLLAMG